MRHLTRGGVTLVTGGTGLIGGEVILALARNGEAVRAVVRAESAAHAHRRLVERLEKSDACSPELLRRIDAVAGDTAQPMFGLQDEALTDVHRVVHGAANTQFSQRQDEQVWNTNVSGAYNLVEIARALPREARILFISTASVTTAPERTCIDEDAPFAGHANTYSRSKRQAEAVIRTSGLDIVIVRPSIVLSRGVRDRAMARSILWAVPIMGEVGDIRWIRTPVSTWSPSITLRAPSRSSPLARHSITGCTTSARGAAPARSANCARRSSRVIRNWSGSGRSEAGGARHPAHGRACSGRSTPICPSSTRASGTRTTGSCRRPASWRRARSPMYLISWD